MPELPEVETVRSTLENQIIGFTIKDVKVLCKRIIGEESIDCFKNKLINKTIKKIQRYGKYLIFTFDDCSMISHLRMEGKYFLKKEDEDLVKHEHVIFYFTNGMTLRYHDTRKFGTMRIVDKTDMKDLRQEKELAKLGPEANTFIDIDEFYNKIHKLHKPIKEILLDQSIICGLGNIYVDEVLYASHLHPETKGTLITKEDTRNILMFSKDILDLAVRAGGTTIRSYTSSLGVTGRFQINLNVHTKEKEPCPKCGTIIEKIRVGGRGTYFCPNCQKNHPLIVGITGSIGSGKSAVTNKLIEDGYYVIDTDKISYDVSVNNKDLLLTIKKAFGKEYFNDDILDRKKMANLIFNDLDARSLLNSIMHPVIKEEVINLIHNSNESLIFIDVPLLFESKFDHLCNKVICVTIDEDIQIDRLIKRDKITKDEAIKRISSQMKLCDKEKLSDFIIDNSQDLCYTYKQLQEIIKKLKGE